MTFDGGEVARAKTRILVTGGAGFVGSHTCKLLAKAGFEPVVYDNLSRGHASLVRFGPLIEGDIRDRAKFRATLQEVQPAACLHFAALAYVGESIANPGLYYENNVHGSLCLLQELTTANGDLANVPLVFFQQLCRLWTM